jgi:hypothetical protein
MQQELYGFYSKTNNTILGSQKWKTSTGEIVIINGLSISDKIDENLLALSEFNHYINDYQLVGKVTGFCGINKLPVYDCGEINLLADLNERISRPKIKHGYFDPDSEKSQTWLDENNNEVIITEIIEDYWYESNYKFKYAFTNKQYMGKITKFIKFN